MKEGVTFVSIRAVRPVQAHGWTDYASEAYSESLDKPCLKSLYDKDIDNHAWQSYGEC